MVRVNSVLPKGKGASYQPRNLTLVTKIFGLDIVWMFGMLDCRLLAAPHGAGNWAPRHRADLTIVNTILITQVLLINSPQQLCNVTTPSKHEVPHYMQVSVVETETLIKLRWEKLLFSQVWLGLYQKKLSEVTWRFHASLELEGMWLTWKHDINQLTVSPCSRGGWWWRVMLIFREQCDNKFPGSHF